MLVSGEQELLLKLQLQKLQLLKFLAKPDVAGEHSLTLFLYGTSRSDTSNPGLKKQPCWGSSPQAKIQRHSPGCNTTEKNPLCLPSRQDQSITRAERRGPSS